MTKPILLLIVSAAFAGGGLFLAATGEPEGGLAVALFFGGCFCVGLGQWLGAREVAAANQRRAASLTADFAFARGRLSVMALGGGLMGAGSGLMGAVGAPQWVSWMGMAFGFTCFLALASRSFDRSAQISFNTYGVTWPRLFASPLPWTTVAAISISPVGIELHAAQGAPTPKPNLFGQPTKRVILTNHLLDGDLPAILAAIHRFHPTVVVLGGDNSPSP